MSNSHRNAGLFPALLKHWRGQRGLSQLDLALAADVSSRHVSFLETGRSTPSPEMILRLAATLDVPLRQVNAMLQSAGHAPAYPEPAPAEGLPAEITSALRMMKEHHDPIDLVKKRLIDAGFADEETLKAIDRDVRAIVAEAAQFAQDSPEPDPSELLTDVLIDA